MYLTLANQVPDIFNSFKRFDIWPLRSIINGVCNDTKVVAFMVDYAYFPGVANAKFYLSRNFIFFRKPKLDEQGKYSKNDNAFSWFYDFWKVAN